VGAARNVFPKWAHRDRIVDSLHDWWRETKGRNAPSEARPMPSKPPDYGSRQSRVDGLGNGLETIEGNRTQPSAVAQARGASPEGIRQHLAADRSRPVRFHTRAVAGSKPAAPIFESRARSPHPTHEEPAGVTVRPGRA
jgi:hypothetical protein